jgi:uncharacterized protein
LDKGGVCGAECQNVMDDATLEKYIKHHYSASTSDTVLFTWHGGEPLLAGIDFYQKALFFQEKYLPQGKMFRNGIQTNGTLITNEWCVFLAEHGFTVGISLDGMEALHNSMRFFKNGKGSFEKTIRGHGLLQAYGINPEILCVVNSCNVYYPLAVYDFFKMLGARYISFLPLVGRRDDFSDETTQESVPALEFGLFLISIFDEWVGKDSGEVKIQIFEEALRTACHQAHSLCIFREECGGVPVVERNGNLYPCDHFVEEERLIGNIHEQSLKYLLNHPAQKAFGKNKQQTLPQYCNQCEVKEMCNGECPKNRFLTSPDERNDNATPTAEHRLNYLCEGYQLFFNHCKPFIQAVSDQWLMENNRR